MALKLFELLSITLSAIVGGLYWGPWLALSRSLRHFTPEVLLPIVHRLNVNMAGVMTPLTPLSLLAILPVLLLSWGQPTTFYWTGAGLLCFLIALVTTVLIEVPIVKQMITWTVDTLPPNWQVLRDRWVDFHIIRVLAGLFGLMCLLAGVLF